MWMCVCVCVCVCSSAIVAKKKGKKSIPDIVYINYLHEEKCNI